MSSVVIPHNIHDARAIVRIVLERMGSIGSYTDNGTEIVAEQKETPSGYSKASLKIWIKDRGSQGSEISYEIKNRNDFNSKTVPDKIVSEFHDRLVTEANEIPVEESDQQPTAEQKTPNKSEDLSQINYCPDCGAEVSDDANYCLVCGAAFNVHRSDETRSQPGGHSPAPKSQTKSKKPPTKRRDNQQFNTDLPGIDDDDTGKNIIVALGFTVLGLIFIAAVLGGLGGGLSDSDVSVRIEYSGDWQGALSVTGGGEASTQSISGSGTRTIEIEGSPSIVSVNAQKRSPGGTIVVKILRNGEVVSESRTSARYGVAQTSERL